tara:strand:+ start:1826 stop:2209 length:384 start_codon:yes stop_codon:yes gene_type:complete
VQLVKSSKQYWEFIRKLRNDPKVKGGFIEQGHITEKQHEAFMEENNDNYYVCVLAGKPVGFVGNIDNDIRVATSPDFQGKGVGKFMIKRISELFPEALAKVKVENEASIRLFEACGFEKKYYLLEKR